MALFSLRSLTITLLATISATLLQAQIKDSVMPIIDSLEKNPPRKYSDRYMAKVSRSLQKKDQKVRVVTYNILFDRFDEQTKDPSYAWTKRLPQILESIQNMQPDVLCLQEVYPKQLEDLQKHLAASFGCFTGNNTSGEINAIFYRKNRFSLDPDHPGSCLFMPLNAKDTLPPDLANPLPPDLEPGRKIMIARLKDKKTQKRLIVLNTHMPYFRINSREEDAYFIQDLVQKELAQSNASLVLTGDFNTFPNRPDLSKGQFYDGPHIENILQSVLNESHQISLLGHIGPLSTFVNHYGNPSLEALAKLPDLALDHIYISPDITVLIHATEKAQVKGRFPSDHLPVVADILLEIDASPPQGSITRTFPDPTR